MLVQCLFKWQCNIAAFLPWRSLKKTEILSSVHQVVLFPLLYGSYNITTCVREKLVSQNPKFVYEKNNQTLEASGMELFEYAGKLWNQLYDVCRIWLWFH
jgi:hypothetical protein